MGPAGPEAGHDARAVASEMHGTPVVARDATDLTLAPFEEALWPDFLNRISLDPSRDYVILAYLPPRVPFDMRGPDLARQSLVRLLSNPVAVAMSPAWIGHLAVAWQCDGRQGVTSHSGDRDRRALRLMAQGWGLSAVLATYDTGGMVPEADFPAAQDRAFATGRGAVLAVEVESTDCHAMRQRLAGFATSERARRYGLLEDPWNGGGAGCLSFGAYLADAAGLPVLASERIYRQVPIPSDLVGLRAVRDGVNPYRPPGLSGHVPARPVSLLRLLRDPWAGPEAEDLRLPDGEAVFAALVAPRAGLSGDGDWRFSRMLPESDPLIGRAAGRARDWAARFPVRRIADPGGVAALVLEH
ncbi:hypothetical protein KUV65_01555 [Maritalea mobilis]|uniref:hypothetical protein n=1 Tax=Maritalea mobilis TaxID=483324 RepID=UPI001C95421E|nr:hypothetical protein [Maritalea mobilis]MBY6200036.1 hypothetical protein [Maritalea mobilis]